MSFPVRCQTNDQYTAKFSVIWWTAASKQFYWWRNRDVIPKVISWGWTVYDGVFCSRWNIFIKTVLSLTKRDLVTSAITAETFFVTVHHCSHLQPGQRRDDESISSFVLPKSSTSQFQLKLCVLCRDWQHYCVNCDLLYNIVNCTLRHLLYCDCYTALWYAYLSLKHYHIVSICRELKNFFFFTNIYPLGIFHLSNSLLKLFLPTSNYLPSMYQRHFTLRPHSGTECNLGKGVV